MRVYVCWDTNASHPVVGDHPCGIAYHDEVPVLVLDDGEVVAGTRDIVSWAKANPAPAAS